VSELSLCSDNSNLLGCSIDDRKRPNPRMRGFIHGSMVIAREKGIRGFFQGFVPTTMRQAANSATRFGSYTFLRQVAQSYVAPGERLGAVSTFGLGAMAGVITVYVTMPLDTIKTRMQSLDARSEYKNSFNCAAKIFKEEGILTFWSGAVPRLARLILSGGIVFTMSVQFASRVLELTVIGMRNQWSLWTRWIRMASIYELEFHS
jgi:solute carrier family 25 (mitochondrial citrate transporter), member 1